MAVDKAVLEIIIKARDEAKKVFEESQRGIEKYSQGFKKAGFAITGASLAMGGALIFAAKSAAEERATINRLRLALNNIEISYDDISNSLESWINAQQFKTGIADEEQRMSLARLLDLTGDMTEAQWLLTGAIDIAAATGRPLETVMQALISAYLGTPGALKTLGIAYDESKSLVENLQNAFEDVEGAAEANVTAFDRLALELADVKDAIGNIIEPYLSPLLNKLSSLLDTLQKTHPELLKFGVGVLAVGSVLGLVVGPLLLLLWMLPSIIAGFSLALPVLAAVAGALGTIAIVVILLIGWVALLVKFWDSSWADIQLGLTIAAAIIIGLLTGGIAWAIIGLIAGLTLLGRHWDTVWDGIKTGFKYTVNAIIEAFNFLIHGMEAAFSFKIPSWIPGIGGKGWSLDIPDIPMLSFDRGGIVPGPIGAPVLATVHGGETVIPSGRTGNIVIPVYIGERKIEEIIVDILSRKAQMQRAW